jgi:hypothetical protein
MATISDPLAGASCFYLGISATQILDTANVQFEPTVRGFFNAETRRCAELISISFLCGSQRPLHLCVVVLRQAIREQCVRRLPRHQKAKPGGRREEKSDGDGRGPGLEIGLRADREP